MDSKSGQPTEPPNAEAWLRLGIERQLGGRHEEALTAYAQALSLDPDCAQAEVNQGLALMALGRTLAAIAAFCRALALRPDDVQIRLNLAAALEDADRPADAIATLQAMADAKSTDARVLAALGNARLAANRPADAIVAYEQALALSPANDHIRYNLALAQLVTGDFARGWPNYDARLSQRRFRDLHPSSQPRWHGDEPLVGRTLLVSGEQGIGDNIQFLRYLPLLQSRGANLIVRIHSAVKPLVSAEWPTMRVIGGNERLPAHDCHCPLPSLPREFGTALNTIPATIPYLHAPPERVATWREVFRHAPGLKVGLVWAGNPKHPFDRQRSIPLPAFLELTGVGSVHFFALQTPLSDSDRRQLSAQPHITDLSSRMTTLQHTAALVTALDLVITVDTAVAHLAGALGTKAWVLLRHSPDWRWLLGRDDSPWYPTLRLFRQPRPGDWATVLMQVRSALADMVRA